MGTILARISKIFSTKIFHALNWKIWNFFKLFYLTVLKNFTEYFKMGKKKFFNKK